uniref:RING-type E3 ubiquitin transferase n=1 Tax=Salix viminalis TaxID=40686 RepID=A0A6N2LP59_SALVM
MNLGAAMRSLYVGTRITSEASEGVKQLEKALDLGRGANPNAYIVDEIWEELAKAKYLEWEEASTQRSWELQRLKSL